MRTFVECMGTDFVSLPGKGDTRDPCETCLSKTVERRMHAFSNGINALLITRPERKIYLSSPGICDQGISASVLLRDEN